MSLAPHQQLKLRRSVRLPINNPPTSASFCPDGSGHHWLIDTPAGALSDGVCKKCGEPRAFKNSGEDTSGFDTEGFVVRGHGKVVGW